MSCKCEICYGQHLTEDHKKATGKEMTTSEPKRIHLVKDMLVIWLKNNNIDYHELTRAQCLLLNEQAAAKRAELFAQKGEPIGQIHPTPVGGTD